MKIYRLEKSINLPITIEECWEFFINPKNLKIITPNYMGFDIIDLEDTKMYSGQIIKYNVTPLLGIKMRWVTEISHVKENSFFVDEQRFGPYKFWHHKHKFEIIDGGVKIIDILDYSLVQHHQQFQYKQLFHLLDLEQSREHIRDRTIPQQILIPE